MNYNFLKVIFSLSILSSVFTTAISANEEQKQEAPVITEETVPEITVEESSEKSLTTQEPEKELQVPTEEQSAPVVESKAVPLEALAEVKRSFSYLSISAGPLPLPIPMASFGYRAQSHHHGVDFGVDIPNFVYLVRGYVNYLYYAEPNVDYQSYIGVGLTYGLGLFWYTKYPAPQFLFGKEFKTAGGKQRFLEIGIQEPSMLHMHWIDSDEQRKATWLIPFIYFRYGFCF